jgi:hypothetical protein
MELHVVVSNTTLKPACVYNWNGVYDPRFYLASWRLFGFRLTTQQNSIPEHKATVFVG